MRILVEPNAHHLQNMGDVAMLQIAVERLSELWPNARIDVITDDAALLRRYCPDASAVPAAGRRIWFHESLLGNRLRQALPARLAVGVRAREDAIRRGFPAVAKHALRLKRRMKRRPTGELENFLTAVNDADLVVVSGAGALADDFAPLTITILDLLELAIRRGIPTAMLGQGVGPIEDLRLRHRAESVLPRVGLIGIREQVSSRPLLKALGVLDERVHLTGDDAVELAFRHGAAGDGHAIGVNVRLARYAGVASDHVEAVADAVKDVAARHGAELVGLPISRYEKELDAAVIATMLDTTPVAPPEEPADVVVAARRCRVVVTGSYHAAVFALAQGIPAVGLAASEYYVSKFEGLVDLFGRGCRLVRVDGDDLRGRLRQEISEAWQSAEDVREELRSAAERQVAAGRQTYEGLRTLLSRAFNCDQQDSPTWDERAAVAAALLRDHLEQRDDSTGPLEIADFGAGNERLRDALARGLPTPHVYRPYDLRPQRPTTVQIDLADELPGRSFDAVFCLGILEYLEDPSAFLDRLSRVTEVAVVSYVVADGSEQLSTDERRARGWLSDLTTSQVEELLARAQLDNVAQRVTNRGRTAVWIAKSRRDRR